MCVLVSVSVRACVSLVCVNVCVMLACVRASESSYTHRFVLPVWLVVTREGLCLACTLDDGPGVACVCVCVRGDGRERKVTGLAFRGGAVPLPSFLSLCLSLPLPHH